jgi:hypothetical protein
MAAIIWVYIARTVRGGSENRLDCADYLRGNSFVGECDHQALEPLYQKQFKGAIYEHNKAEGYVDPYDCCHELNDLEPNRIIRGF